MCRYRKYTFANMEAFFRIWETAVVEWRDRGPTRNFLHDFITDIIKYCDISVKDILFTMILGILFTFLRSAANELLFKPITAYFQFIPKDRTKFPESAWKMVYYTCTYSFCLYILFGGKLSIFQDPVLCWEGWHPTMPIPTDIYILYILQAGFYFHSIYATLFMDKWRRDSILMICHHVLANCLLLFSFASRYHNMGLLVLFLHDISDILLEGTKVITCFKSRPGGPHRIADALVIVGFLSFAASWCVCRLYLYPQKVLYATGYLGRAKYKDAPFYFSFNGMLWLLFAMNVWWFHFILLLVWRVLNGSSREVEDTREISSSDSPVEEDVELKRKKQVVQNGTANGPVDLKNAVKDQKSKKEDCMNGELKGNKIEIEEREEKDGDGKEGKQEKEYLRHRKHNTRGN